MSNGNSSSVPNVQSLFANALSAGILTPAAQAVVVPNMTAQIQAAISGTPADDVEASSVVLFGMALDNSGSMGEDGKDAACRDGVNLCVDAVLESKEADGILAHASPFNGSMLFPFTPVKQIPRVNDRNFPTGGGTPLFDKFAAVLAATLAKGQEFRDNGVPYRGVVFVATDGMDEHSTSHRRPEDVAPLVKAALATETMIVAFMGFGSYNFRDVARRMGIEDRWVLTDKDDKHGIRQCFQMMSKSLVRASQAVGANAFSKAAAGGFGTP